MIQLPEQYKWLLNEPGPKMLLESLKLYGVKEHTGAGDNPIILEWAKEVGLTDVYKHDETSWCGLDMAVVAKRAGKPVVNQPLWALNWAKFGFRVEEPSLGDVLVFKRFNAKGKLIGGHVALYVGEDKDYYHCLGGNQNDMHNITRVAKNRLHAARMPPYKNPPENIRRVFLSPTGAVTTNEQ